MSGIVAVLADGGAPVDPALLARLTATMRTRGPDAEHVWTGGPVGLGHTLLATTIEPAPPQPATLDGEVWITADARLAARRDLRTALRGAGRDVAPDTADVMLILHAYATWGTDCAARLLGDYAFVLWDGRRRRLVAARSGFGVKPLYWARVQGALLVGNTMQALLAHPACGDALDEQWIAEFLIDGHSADAAATVFAEIRRVPAGHTLVIDGEGRPTLRRHWEFPVPEPVRLRSDGEVVERFREVLGAAVEDRLRTRSLAMFLSGGIDSPTLAVTAQERLTETGGAMHAYTSVVERLVPDDEGHYASLVAHSLGIPQDWFAVDHHEILDERIDAAGPLPEPVDNPVYSSYLEMAGAAAARSRVAFNGEDGDALLRPPGVRTMFRTLPIPALLWDIGRYWVQAGRLPYLGTGVIGAFRRRSAPRPARVHSRYPAWLRPDAVRSLELEERARALRDGCLSSAHPLRPEMHRLLTSSVWPQFLESVNPAFTGLPLEVRFPLLDTRLIAFVATIPPVPWCQDKELFRAAMRGRLPEPVLRRPKVMVHSDYDKARLNQAAARLVVRPSLASPLDRFVDASALPPLDGSTDVHLALSSLRPHIMDAWLRHHLPRLRSPLLPPHP